MDTSRRLGKDPLGRLTPPDEARAVPPAADDPLARILDTADPACQAGPTGREYDAVARGRELLRDMVDVADIAPLKQPVIEVDMDSDLTELPMRDAYLLGHALRLILDLARTEAQAASEPVRIRLTGRLSGRLELSVTDAGDAFSRDLGFVPPADDLSRELIAFVSRRGGSVFLTRCRATQVTVTVHSRPEAASRAGGAGDHENPIRS